jgi:transcriptional regulator with XRE-family HTH domain
VRAQTEFQRAVGARVRELRLTLDWTEVKLAAAAEVEPSEVTRLELGGAELTFSLLLKLARALCAELNITLRPMDDEQLQDYALSHGPEYAQSMREAEQEVAAGVRGVPLNQALTRPDCHR